MTLADEILTDAPSDPSALSQFLAADRGLATAMAMAGNRAGALQQAQMAIARGESGVNAGSEKRTLQRHLAECIIELGSIYEILAKRSSPERQSHDWEAARSTLRRAVALMDPSVAGVKPSPIDTADIENARHLLADAERHLSASAVGNP